MTEPNHISDAHPKQSSQEKEPTDSSLMKITVEFTGGLELLFSNVTLHRLFVPRYTRGHRTTVGDLIEVICRDLMVDERREVFVLEEDGDGNHVGDEEEGGDERGKRLRIRPGILVLVDDVDWEIGGEESWELGGGEGVLFVSTLHGG